ncbi:FliH/SctL family protein [Novosphingobium sp.]|uniref:FliH/SctL family protein n=1 Tax=Novosphingobium sp. TaxID=1874826 RepID=UPI003B5270A5
MSERATFAALGARTSIFSRDARFTPILIEPATPFDPVADAFARGYSQGAQDGTTAAQANMASNDAARHRIETALSHMDTSQTEAFAARLKDTVLALCSAVLGEAAIAPANLAARVEVAAALFNRATDDRVIRMHPEDLALVHGRLPETWHCEPDPAAERGTVRIETATGGVEDGPAQWRAALDDAIRSC